MKKTIALIACLGLGAGLSAADVSPTAAAAPVSPAPAAVEAVTQTAAVAVTPEPTLAPKAPAPLAPPWDKVQLKDGQKLEGKIRGYDAYFLEVEAPNAHHFSLPWKEVASVQAAEFSGDTALMKGYLSTEQVTVTSHVERKDSSAALKAAFWPGTLVHGYGYRVAGNKDMFYSLVCAEAFGGLMAGVGGYTVSDSSTSPDNKAMANAMLWGGVGVFVVSWAWDIIGAPMSADSFNQKNGLSLITAPLPSGGALLGFSKGF
jgi:hypothetical protein